MGLTPFQQTGPCAPKEAKMEDEQSGTVGALIHTPWPEPSPEDLERVDREVALDYALRHAELRRLHGDVPSASQVVTSAKRFAKFLTEGW